MRRGSPSWRTRRREGARPRERAEPGCLPGPQRQPPSRRRGSLLGRTWCFRGAHPGGGHPGWLGWRCPGGSWSERSVPMPWLPLETAPQGRAGAVGRRKLPSATSEAGSLSTAPHAPSQNLPDGVRKLVAVTDTGLGSCPALCQQRRTEMQLCEGGQDPGSRQAAQQPQRFDEGAASTPPRRGTPGRGSRDVPRAGCPAAHCAAAVGRDGGPDSAQPAWPGEPGSEAWMSGGLAETPSLLRPAPSPAPWEWGRAPSPVGARVRPLLPALWA